MPITATRGGKGHLGEGLVRRARPSLVPVTLELLVPRRSPKSPLDAHQISLNLSYIS